MSIPLPAWARRPVTIELPVVLWSRPARALARWIPLVMMAAGILIAVLSAAAAERPATEGIGSLGVEAGAALWFGGAVTIGVRARPTILRVVFLAGTGLAGMLLVALALARGWTGAGLALAMEFGVGAVAIAVIDTVLLGIVHPRLQDVADRDETARVTIRLGRSPEHSAAGTRPAEHRERAPD